MGFVIVFFIIKDVCDKNGYFELLGKLRIV